MPPPVATAGIGAEAPGDRAPRTEWSTLSCQACGACCAYSAEWPRFTTEDDAELDLIPPAYVSADGARMRCEGNRCSALTGQIGVATACTIYGLRPDVCRVCLPGDAECLMARQAFGLPV